MQIVITEKDSDFLQGGMGEMVQVEYFEITTSSKKNLYFILGLLVIIVLTVLAGIKLDWIINKKVIVYEEAEQNISKITNFSEDKELNSVDNTGNGSISLQVNEFELHRFKDEDEEIRI